METLGDDELRFGREALVVRCGQRTGEGPHQGMVCMPGEFSDEDAIVVVAPRVMDMWEEQHRDAPLLDETVNEPSQCAVVCGFVEVAEPGYSAAWGNADIRLAGFDAHGREEVLDLLLRRGREQERGVGGELSLCGREAKLLLDVMLRNAFAEGQNLTPLGYFKPGLCVFPACEWADRMGQQRNGHTVVLGCYGCGQVGGAHSIVRGVEVSAGCDQQVGLIHQRIASTIGLLGGLGWPVSSPRLGSDERVGRAVDTPWSQEFLVIGGCLCQDPNAGLTVFVESRCDRCDKRLDSSVLTAGDTCDDDVANHGLSRHCRNFTRSARTRS